MRAKFALFAVTMAIAGFLPWTAAAYETVFHPIPDNTPEKGGPGQSNIYAIPDISLTKGELYQSPYIDVRAFRQLTFYVTNGQDSRKNTLTGKCKLDAFFSLKIGGVMVQQMGQSKAKLVDDLASEALVEYRGSQDFGDIHTGAELDGEAFKLSIPVFGPFVRVELQNLSEGRDTFQIFVYMTPV